MDKCTEIAEIVTDEGYLYFRYDPEHYEDLEQEIAAHLKPDSVVFIACYPIH